MRAAVSGSAGLLVPITLSVQWQHQRESKEVTEASHRMAILRCLLGEVGPKALSTQQRSASSSAAQRSLQLRVFGCFQHGTKLRSGLVAGRDQVFAP